MKYINVTEAITFLQDALIDAKLVGDTVSVTIIEQAIALVEPLAV